MGVQWTGHLSTGALLVEELLQRVGVCLQVADLVLEVTDAGLDAPSLLGGVLEAVADPLEVLDELLSEVVLQTGGVRRQ